MGKKLWVIMALLLVIPGLMFTTSCAKKAVKKEPAGMTQAEIDAAAKKAAEEKARQAELEAQKKAKLEEERLAKEAAEKMKAEQERLAREKALNQFQGEHVYFAFDSSVLDDAAQQVLRAKADYLNANPGTNIMISGHCDERGTVEYNLALGDRRAESAKGFLVQLGIAAARITTISYGEEQPVDMGHNEEAWAKNRRAEFDVQ